MEELTLDIWKLSQKGYCCAQIMLRLALDTQGEDNPGLVAAMAGLCHGTAQRGGPCGVLTGGACLLAYHGAKGADHETAHDRLPLMLEEFSDWFAQTVGGRFGGITCAAIAGENEPDQSVCGGILEESFNQALAILTENGLDPTQPRP